MLFPWQRSDPLKSDAAKMAQPFAGTHIEAHYPSSYELDTPLSERLALWNEVSLSRYGISGSEDLKESFATHGAGSTDLSTLKDHLPAELLALMASQISPMEVAECGAIILPRQLPSVHFLENSYALEDFYNAHSMIPSLELLDGRSVNLEEAAIPFASSGLLDARCVDQTLCRLSQGAIMEAPECKNDEALYLRIIPAMEENNKHAKSIEPRHSEEDILSLELQQPVDNAIFDSEWGIDQVHRSMRFDVECRLAETDADSVCHKAQEAHSFPNIGLTQQCIDSASVGSPFEERKRAMHLEHLLPENRVANRHADLFALDCVALFNCDDTWKDETILCRQIKSECQVPSVDAFEKMCDLARQAEPLKGARIHFRYDSAYIRRLDAPHVQTEMFVAPSREALQLDGSVRRLLSLELRLNWDIPRNPTERRNDKMRMKPILIECPIKKDTLDPMSMVCTGLQERAMCYFQQSERDDPCFLLPHLCEDGLNEGHRKLNLSSRQMWLEERLVRLSNDDISLLHAMKCDYDSLMGNIRSSERTFPLTRSSIGTLGSEGKGESLQVLATAGLLTVEYDKIAGLLYLQQMLSNHPISGVLRKTSRFLKMLDGEVEPAHPKVNDVLHQTLVSIRAMWSKTRILMAIDLKAAFIFLPLLSKLGETPFIFDPGSQRMRSIGLKGSSHAEMRHSLEQLVQAGTTLILLDTQNLCTLMEGDAWPPAEHVVVMERLEESTREKLSMSQCWSVHFLLTDTESLMNDLNRAKLPNCPEVHTSPPNCTGKQRNDETCAKVEAAPKERDACQRERSQENRVPDRESISYAQPGSAGIIMCSGKDDAAKEEFNLQEDSATAPGGRGPTKRVPVVLNTERPLATNSAVQEALRSVGEEAFVYERRLPYAPDVIAWTTSGLKGICLLAAQASGNTNWWDIMEETASSLASMCKAYDAIYVVCAISGANALAGVMQFNKLDGLLEHKLRNGTTTGVLTCSSVDKMASMCAQLVRDSDPGPCGSFFEEALSQHNETNLEVELGIDPYTSLALAEAGISSGDLGSLDVYDIVERVWRQTYVKIPDKILETLFVRSQTPAPSPSYQQQTEDPVKFGQAQEETHVPQRLPSPPEGEMISQKQPLEQVTKNDPPERRGIGQQTLSTKEQKQQKEIQQSPSRSMSDLVSIDDLAAKFFTRKGGPNAATRTIQMADQGNGEIESPSANSRKAKRKLPEASGKLEEGEKLWEWDPFLEDVDNTFTREDPWLYVDFPSPPLEERKHGTAHRQPAEALESFRPREKEECTLIDGQRRRSDGGIFPSQESGRGERWLRGGKTGEDAQVFHPAPRQTMRQEKRKRSEVQQQQEVASANSRQKRRRSSGSTSGTGSALNESVIRRMKQRLKPDSHNND